jgi:para-nitrobenzyl esterase
MRLTAIFLATLGAALAALGQYPADADPSSGPVVHTRSGDVASIVDGSVVEWRAIPYAAPPLGDLRWRPPTPAQAWDGVRLSTDFAPVCPQLVGPGQVDGSEDCLYLNVSAPVGVQDTAALPVMVHLHPGGNLGFHAYRNADAFVERGVVVVTLGYRLGALGFAGHPELTQEGAGSSGEYGVLDQLAALRWVRENIAGFGGDPDNVTLFGESAGAVDAVAIAASPLSDGLIARVAAQSGYFPALHGRGSIDDAEALGSDIADAVGCSSHADVVGCMRGIAVEDIVRWEGPSLWRVNGYTPWVGGEVLTASPIDLIRSDTTPVPMLVGSTREEGAFFAASDGLFPPGEDYPAFARTRDLNSIAGPQHGRHLRELYPVDAYESSYWATAAAISDAGYTCPMRSLALAGRAPVYRYLYTHGYDDVPDPVIAAAKASHFFDDPVLWHDPALLFGLDFEFSAAEEVLADRMADYWTNFAKTGDPNGPGAESWMTFSAGAENTKVLDEPPADLADGYHVAQCELLGDIPDIYAPPQAYTPIAGGR